MNNDAIDRGIKLLRKMSGYDWLDPRQIENVLEAMKEPEGKCWCGMYQCVCGDSKDPIREVYKKWNGDKRSSGKSINVLEECFDDMWNAIKEYCEGEDD